VEFSVRHPSPPNTYSYKREENLGSTRKFVEIYLLFMCITNLILALHMQSVNCWRNLSKTAEKSSSSPLAVGVIGQTHCAIGIMTLTIIF
jgi:hypothetical protein